MGQGTSWAVPLLQSHRRILVHLEKLSLRFQFEFRFPAHKKHSLSANELYFSKNIVRLPTSCIFSAVTQASVFVYKKAEYSLFADKLYFFSGASRYCSLFADKLYFYILNLVC